MRKVFYFYFLVILIFPRNVNVAFNATSILRFGFDDFNKTSAKRGSMFSETFIACDVFSNVSQVYHMGILSRIRACEQ